MKPHRRISFEDMLFLLKSDADKSASRSGWSQGVFICVCLPRGGDEITRPFIMIDTLDSKNPNPDYIKGRVPYVPNQCDLFANDWVITE